MARGADIELAKTIWGEYGRLIEEHSLANNVPPEILAGLIARESSGNPWAARAEPNYRWVYGDDAHEALALPPGVSQETDLFLQRISYGLCQLMGGTIRWLGYQGELPRLFEPNLNIAYGAKYLARLFRQTGNMHDALLRYNGGGDSDYPKKVFFWADIFVNTVKKTSNST